MTKIFSNSALFYDAIYQNKEYKKEAAYVVQSLREFDFTAKKILELGCGTGNYSFILRDHGYEVLGIDASKEMISLAKKKQPSLGEQNIDFEACNSEDFHTDLEWDFAVSLFFMLGYQLTDASLMRTFHAVHSCLKNGGTFAFDFWYGPSVLKKGCSPNEIHVETNNHKMIRKSSPSIIHEDSCLRIMQSYSIQNKKTGKYEDFNEVHKVRYFDEKQLSSFLNKCGFEVIRFEAFMGHKPLQDTDWAGMAFARAT